MAEYTSYCDKFVSDVLSKLKLAMSHYNLTLQAAFSKLDTNQDFSLNRQEFGAALKQIDPTITAYEIGLAFDRFDTDKSDSINYSEFYAYFDKVQVPPGTNYQTQEQMKEEQKSTSVEKLQKLQEEEKNIKTFAEYAINKLKQAIIYYKIDLQALFKKYDTSPDNSLDVNEFQTLILEIEPNLQTMDILSAFAIFDKDKNYSINIQEFVAVLQV